MKYKSLAVVAFASISLGLIFKDETLVVNIGDTYYVANYLTLSIYLLYILGLITFYNLIIYLKY